MQTILMEYLSRLLNLQKNKFQVDTVEFATNKHALLKSHSSSEICIGRNETFIIYYSAQQQRNSKHKLTPFITNGSFASLKLMTLGFQNNVRR